MEPRKLLLCLFLVFTANAQRSEKKCEGWRLPTDVRPTHYDITFRIPSSSEDETFTGSVQIDIVCNRPTDTIILHAHNLYVNMSFITVQPKRAYEKPLRIVGSSIDEERNTIVLKLEEKMSKGSEYVLGVPVYSGNLVGTGETEYFKTGLYRDYENGRVVYNTFFEPFHARDAFPCFDEPAMKATFTVRVERSNPFKSFSNMPLNNTMQLPSGRYLDTFDESPLMSTYTLAIAVNEYSIYEKENSRTRIIAPGSDIKDFEHLHKIADDILVAMEKYTNIPYPLSKLDHVMAPSQRFPASHCWGLITYGRTLFEGFQILMMNEAMIYHGAQIIGSVVAYQWFGNLVTADWWTHMWLNEALSTYITLTIADKILPKSTREFLGVFQSFPPYDTRYAVEPVSLQNTCEVKNHQAGLHYGAGVNAQRVLTMFRAVLGSEERFQQAVRIFLKNGKLKNVKPEHFFKALDQVNSQLEKSHLPDGVSFKDLGKQWTQQEGLPLVTVIRDYASGAVHFKQKPHLHNPSKSNRWWIPLTWSTASKPDVSPLDGPQDWFYEDKTIPLNLRADEWLLVNVNYTGFYQVNYDEQNWSLLAQALDTTPELFSAESRVQLLAKAFALTTQNRLDIPIVAKLLNQFTLREEDTFTLQKQDKFSDTVYWLMSLEPNLF